MFVLLLTLAAELCVAVCVAVCVAGRYRAPRPYWPARTLPQLRAFTPETQARIRRELLSGAPPWIAWPERYLKGGDDWHVIPLFAFGTWLAPSALFPHTTSVLRRCEGMRTALFSKLNPGTRLTPHHGYACLSNRMLRCHVVLQCEARKSYLEVNGKRRYVSQGDVVVFDDSLLHTAGNEGGLPRFVLLVDFDRPRCVAPGTSPVEATTDELVALCKEFGIPEARVG